MDALELGSLWHQYDQKPFSCREVEMILHDMLDALNCVHMSGLIHFDVKPENIMVQRRDRKMLIVQLGDFGFASPRLSTRRPTGTFHYAAPEIFDSNGPYSAKVDIWSLGLVILRLIWSPKMPDLNEEEHFGPQNPCANGWRGNIRTAMNEVLYYLQLPPYPSSFSVNTESPMPIEGIKRTQDFLCGDAPQVLFAAILDMMLQVLSEHRLDAFGALNMLKKWFGIGYFNSLDSVVPGINMEAPSFGSPPPEVMPRSPFFGLEMESKPEDLAEHFEISANKSDHFNMTHNGKYVQLDSIFDATDVPTEEEDDMTANMKRHLRHEYFSVPDAWHLCDRLRLKECKKHIIQAQEHHYCPQS